jgi:hypothetical protein
LTGGKADLGGLVKSLFKDYTHNAVDNLLKSAAGAFGLGGIAGKPDGTQFNPWFVTLTSAGGLPGLASSPGAGGDIFSTLLGAVGLGGSSSAAAMGASLMGSHPDGSMFNPFYVVSMSGQGGILSSLAGGGSSSDGGLLKMGGDFISSLFGGGSAGVVAPDIASEVAPLGANSLASLADLSWAMFDGGGFTGSGGKYQPAGIVHKGEFVFDQASVNRIGVGNLVKLQRGYADGGLVGGPSGMGGMGGVQVNVIDQRSNQSAPVQTTTRQQGNQQIIEVLVRDAVNKQIAAGGFDAVMQTTYGVGRAGVPR